MTTAVTHAREAIEQQLEPLAKEVAELEDRLLEIRQTKTQLEAALKALSGSKAAKKAKPRKQSKPFACKEQVMAVCQTIVRENQPILRVDLEELAKDKLGKDMGFSLSGVQLRLRECLASSTFVIDDKDLVSLAVVKPQSGQPAE